MNSCFAAFRLMDFFTFGINTCCVEVVFSEKSSKSAEFLDQEIEPDSYHELQEQKYLNRQGQNVFTSEKMQQLHCKIMVLQWLNKEYWSHTHSALMIHTHTHTPTHSCSFFAYWRDVWNKRSSEIMTSRGERNRDVWVRVTTYKR